MEAETTAALVRLLRQDELPPPLCDLGKRYLLQLARAGKLGPIKPIRVTPHSPPLFAENEVTEFMASRLREAREGSQ